MVSTRNHPSQFPPPELSPTKTTAVSSTGSPSKRSTRSQANGSADGDLAVVPRSRARSINAWSHTPSTTTLLWLAFSLPLVIWDTGYVLGRPHTMPGGKLHKPLWSPYDLYGTVDHLYGFPAWNNKNGFTGAQSMLNVIETLMYFAYLWVSFAHGRPELRKGGAGASAGFLAPRKLVGREAGLAVIIGFAAAVMTLSKTVLYWLVLYYAGWEGIGHNDWQTLVPLWIIPNGLWIVFSLYMSYAFGSEILSGLEQAAGLPQKKSQ